jgi:membrane-bound lytic murein transglycosylase B
VLEFSSLGLATVLLVSLLAALATVGGAQPPPEPLPISVEPLDLAVQAEAAGSTAGAPGSEPEPTLRSSPRPADRQQVDAHWLAVTAARTGIPERALTAYATADLMVTADLPRCRVHWPTLAGIGAVESGHGNVGGGLVASGSAARPIIGVALDGRPGVATLLDSDAGRIDGDRTHDRAVGPMQFVPSTWATWRADGDDDGVADPQDLDDAALAAARYLCSSGTDLSSAAGWTRAVLAYNPSMDYVRAVNQAAAWYAGASRG